MDGELIYPGDLHGRVIRANTVELAWDGNAMSALVGDDLVVGVSGFGDSVHDALRQLAETWYAGASGLKYRARTRST